jgi:hypothetical protein
VGESGISAHWFSKTSMGVNAQVFGHYQAWSIFGSHCTVRGCGLWTMAAQGELLTRSQIDHGVGEQ